MDLIKPGVLSDKVGKAADVQAIPPAIINDTLGDDNVHMVISGERITFHPYRSIWMQMCEISHKG